MKIAFHALVALAITAAPALASTVDTQAAAPATVQDPQALPLARQFVALLYPDAAQGAVDQLRDMTSASLETVGDKGLRNRLSNEIQHMVVRATPIMERRMPALMEAYAAAYAREFTTDELRDLIAFGSSPTGKHFLDDLDFSDDDAEVAAASDAMREEITPLLQDLQKAMCKRATETRLAAGDKTAKCTRA